MNIIEKYITEGKSWMDAVKKVEKDGMLYINPRNNDTSEEKKKGYIVLDNVTANMLLQISGALDKVANQQFTSMPFLKAVDIGWKLVRRKR